MQAWIAGCVIRRSTPTRSIFRHARIVTKIITTANSQKTMCLLIVLNVTLWRKGSVTAYIRSNDTKNRNFLWREDMSRRPAFHATSVKQRGSSVAWVQHAHNVIKIFMASGFRLTELLTASAATFPTTGSQVSLIIISHDSRWTDVTQRSSVNYAISQSKKMVRFQWNTK